MKLDVGSGNNPQGDVNCDLYKYYSPQIDQMKEHKLTKIWRSSNFVQCDGQYLPFKDSCFEEVYCSNVVEHTHNPILIIKELLRVSCGTVLLRVPHRFGTGAKAPYHFSYFSVTWFSNLLRYKYPFQIECTQEGFPHSLLGLFMLPHEITVRIKKIP